MAHSNRPLTSREFKIMLQTDHFTDRKKGVKEISSIIESIIEKQGGKFEAPNNYDEVERRTWFLDTNAYELYCDKKFLLRIRKEKGSGVYDVTLKCRHPDRYVCALYDLSAAEDAETKFKTKFEEDIITSKMTDGSVTSISKFSLSATLEDKEIPDFKKIKDLVSIFPNLELGGIGFNEPLTVVNNFKAIEISSKIGAITFSDDDNDVVPELNLWYSPTEDEKPLIIEFTFKCKATKHDKDKDEETFLEKYPKKLVLGASKFYESLQKCNNIIDLDTTKTKTDFVYQKKCKP
jgi:hypothetical protein